MNYIPLNIKTNYELLTSIIKLNELISFAKKNNFSSLSITDSNMFYTMEFYNECKKNDIKPIIGVDLTIDDISFKLYCKNFNGYKNLCKIVSERNINTLTFDFIKKYNKDLKCILDYKSINKYNEIINYVDEVFIGYKNKKERNSALLITDKIVYIKEILSLYEKDLEYVKYLWMIRDGKTISDEINYDLEGKFFNIEIDPIDKSTTMEFASDLNLEFPKFKYSLPKYDATKNSEELLKSLCVKGLYKRLNGKVTNKYADRLKYELDVIISMGYTDYFLIVYDFILFAKKNKIIVGPGRGSGAGSLVCYSLGIIEIDPLKFNLIFERFLNPERVTMPDIDTDFEYLRRDEVISYVKNKYGEKNVANIITFGTLLPKQVVRDVGRVLELDIYDIDNICKTIKDKESFEELKNNEKFTNIIKSNSKYKKLLEICEKLEGLKRHTSIHAAGVVISDVELTEKIPLYKSGDHILTGYSMEYMESVGLLKMDFLGLRNLTIIDNIIKLIYRDTKKHINLNEISFNDEKSLKLFHDADTVGIFQFESNGMKAFLRKLKVRTFEDIVAALSLYRPGPRDNIDLYIRRREGKSKISYLLPELEPVLKDTYGIIIYQEQIIEILRVIADYSYSEADNIRRAMSKKKEDVILAEKDRFLKRTTKKGIDINKAKELYDLVLKFSNYGFNKSHSVAYAYISFYMAYLKSNYTGYFIANILNIHIGSDVKTKEYIDEAKYLKLNLIKPDVNISTQSYEVKDNSIILPLSIIKNIGKEAIKKIIEERNKNKFKDFFDFVSRTYCSSVNKKVIESMINAGCFDKFGYNKSTLHKNLDNAIDYALLCKDLDSAFVLKPEINVYPEYDKNELMNLEFESFGFYLNMHPVTKYRRDNMVKLKNIEQYFDKIVNIVVLIENVKNINTKNKERMAFLTLSDEYRRIEGVVFPKTYKKIIDFNKGDVVRLAAKVERRMDSYQLIVNDLEILK